MYHYSRLPVAALVVVLIPFGVAMFLLSRLAAQAGNEEVPSERS